MDGGSRESTLVDTMPSQVNPASDMPTALKRRAWRQGAVGAMLFGVSLSVFAASPVHQVTDSHYSMLLTENLLKNGDFALDAYFVQPLDPSRYPGLQPNGYPYHVQVVNDRVYYYGAIGSSILSLPFVAALNATGTSAIASDGMYDPAGEQLIQTRLAAALMAALVTILFFTSTRLLPIGWSVLIALSAGFATQVWSTASRALWPDTWQVVLLASVILLLVRLETGERRINAVLLGSLLAWMYFARPTSSIPIAAITIYILLFHRALLARCVITGAVWLALFVGYSWYTLGRILPDYYSPGAAHTTGVSLFDMEGFWWSLAAHLISPSRGLFVYVPVLGLVAYLLLRYRRHIAVPRLVVLAAVLVVLHLMLISSLKFWWVAASYGPRYTTELVPWFALFGMAAVQARLSSRRSSASTRDGGRVEAVGATILLAVSVLLNARGATAYPTWAWNAVPKLINEDPSKVWDWGYPQFLAGWIAPGAGPRETRALAPRPDLPHYVARTRLQMATEDAGRYLGLGWSAADPAFRMSDGRRVEILFAIDDITPSVLEMRLWAYLVPGRVERQTVGVVLNDQRVATWVVSEPGMETRTASLPDHILRHENVLSLELPDAVQPSSLGASADSRLLSIGVEWVQFR